MRGRAMGYGLAAGLLLLAASAAARPGTVDRSFADRGWVLVDFRDHNDSGEDLAIQANGRILVAGRTRLGGRECDFALTRLGRAGRLDREFADDGRAHVSFGPDADACEAALSVAVQDDGKIVLAGYTHARVFGPETAAAIARYTPEGRLDRSFSGNGRAIVEGLAGAQDVVITGGGRILIAGDANGGSDIALARLLKNGRLDRNYGEAGVVATDLPAAGGHALALALQRDGRAVIAGSGVLESNPGDELMLAARYTRTGPLDETFSGDGWTMVDIAGDDEDQAAGVALQPDGRIVLGGSVGFGDLAVARLTRGGAPDPEFSGEGQATTDLDARVLGDDVGVQRDGRIVVLGQAHDRLGDRFALARYRPGGALDRRFTRMAGLQLGGPGRDQYPRALAIGGDQIVVAGTAYTRRHWYDIAVTRISAR